jgi:hypothetical protein
MALYSLFSLVEKDLNPVLALCPPVISQPSNHLHCFSRLPSRPCSLQVMALYSLFSLVEKDLNPVLALCPPVISQPSNYLHCFFVCQADPDHLPKIQCAAHPQSWSVYSQTTESKTIEDWLDS